MRSVKLTLSVVLWAVVLGQVSSADQAADEVSIRESVQAYVKAYNEGDSKTLAAMWSPDAVYAHPVSGEQVVGRDAIEQQFSAIFAENKDTKLTAITDSVQFISPGVAVEYGTALVARSDQAPEESNYTAVYVKRDGAWLLDRMTEEDVPVVLSHQDQLKELEWMIGTWIDSDDQATVVTTSQWTKNRNFITRMMSMEVGDQIESSGMQIIGWDPAAKTIRSWIFDSNGGFGEGHWTQKDKTWQIQSTATLPDGSKSSSTNIMTYVDNNTFTWQSINRVVDGELLPNVDEVVVARQEGQSGSK